MDERDDERNSAPGIGGDGAPALTTWVERLLGRSLGDVRVHDSTQAGELAGRLGARAFTAGRHVYLPADLLRAPTPQRAALLAHELAHAVEQAGAPPALPPPPAPARAGAGPLLAVSRKRVPVQRAPDAPGDSEERARAVEAAALQAQQAPQAQAPALDPEELAERIYRRMVADLRTENERVAGAW